MVRDRIQLKQFLGAAVAAAALLAAPASGQEQGEGGSDSPIKLSIEPKADEFVSGEPIVLDLTATNEADEECSLLSVPDLALRIDSVTRDGETVKPEMSRVAAILDEDSRVSGDLEPTAPGDSVSFEVGANPGTNSDAQDLMVMVPLARGGSVLSSWDISEPGDYEVDARYTMPTLQYKGEGACTGTSEAASASFTVLPPEEDGWFDSLWFKLLLLALIFLIAAAVWYRRHGAAARLSLLLVVAIVPGFVTPGPGPAKAATAAECFQIFETTKGGDPAKILPLIGERGVNINIVLLQSGHSSANPNAKPPTVNWNPNDVFPLPDGVPANDCATLYHELVHASQGLNDTYGEAMCGNSGEKIAEVYATTYENKFRKAHGLPPRTTYGNVNPKTGKLIPLPKLSECDNKKQKKERKKKDNPCAKVPPGACGRNDSNPPPPPAPPPPAPPAPAGGGGAGGAGGGAAGGGAAGPAGGQGSGPGSTGDPHLLTHDYLAYDMQAAGELVLMRTEDGQFEVQSRQEPYLKSKTVAVNTAVAVGIEGTSLGFYLNDSQGIEVIQDGEEVELEDGPNEVAAFTVTRRPSYNPFEPDGYTVTIADGSSVDIDREGPYGLRTYVRLAEERGGAISGLLGDYDGNPENDLVPAGGGEPVDPEDFDALYGEFTDSWRVTDESSLFTYEDGQSTKTFTDPGFPKEPATVNSLDKDTQEMAEELCTEIGITDENVLQDCILDVGVTGQADFAAGAQSQQLAIDTAMAEAATEDAAGGPASEGEDIGPGDTVEGTLDEEGEQVVYSFNAEEGDVAYFQTNSECAKGGDPNIQWYVKETDKIDQEGAELGLGLMCDDVGRVRFAGDGGYSVVVDSTYLGALGDYSFTWVPVVSDETSPLEIGEETTGEIELGELDIFEFDAEEGDQLSYQPASDCTSDEGVITWRVVADVDIYSSVNNAEFPEVAQGTECDEDVALEFDHDGTYAITFQGGAIFDAVGAYGFSLDPG